MSDANYSDTTNEETNSSTTTKTEKPNFFTTLASQLIYLILMIIIGGIMLYSSKISQTGIMPVNINCEPFTSFSNRRIDEVVLNIDVVKMKEGNQSTKITFPYESNNNIICNSFLGVSFLKSWVEGEDSNPYTRYIGTIWQSLYASAFSLYNTFYSMLARYFTESMIVFLGPFILPYVSILYGIILTFYGFLLFFIKFYMLFGEKDMCPSKKNENGPDTTYVIWKDPKDALYKGFNWVFCIIFGIILICCFFYLFLLSAALTFVSVLTANILPLLLNARVVTSSEKPQTEYTFFNTLENIFKYKLNIIMYIISYYILIDSYNSIGSYGVFIAIVSFIFIYIFYPEIYKSHTPNIEQNASTKGLASIRPNNSICEKMPKFTEEERTKFTCITEPVVPTLTWLDWFFGADDENDSDNGDINKIPVAVAIGKDVKLGTGTSTTTDDNKKLGDGKPEDVKLGTTPATGTATGANKKLNNKEITSVQPVQQNGGSRSKKNK